MNISDYLKLISLGFASILCGGGLVSVIVKYLADWLSQRMLDHYNNKHQKELESIKNDFSNALVKVQHEYDKLKQKHYLYSQSQFELYNSLWKQLIYTRRLADDLWKDADPQKIPSFASQIGQTKLVIEENMLLIEESHYKELLDLMSKFDEFKFGKQTLIEIRQTSVDSILENIDDIKDIINKNSEAKERYDVLVTKVGNSFRNQIHG